MNIVNTSVLIAYFESIEVYCTDMHLQLKENQHNALAVKSCLTIETPAPLQSTVLFGSGHLDTIGHQTVSIGTTTTRSPGYS